MGLYIKMKRVGVPFIPYNDAVERKTVAALELLIPFTRSGDYLQVDRIAIHRYFPIRSSNIEEAPLLSDSKLSGPGIIGKVASILGNLLKEAKRKWGTLYETYISIDFTYSPPGKPRIPFYLLVSNGRIGLPSIELDSYDWIYNDKVVETLEESLNISGYPRIRDLLVQVGLLNKNVQGNGFIVDRAVIGRNPDALEDLSSAKGVWLPTKQRLLSFAIDTLSYKRDFDLKAADLFDYYLPYRRDLVVSLIGNTLEYEAYLASRRLKEFASITAVASIIIESKNDDLKELFDRIVDDLLRPFAERVLENRKSSIEIRAREYIKKEFKLMLRKLDNSNE
ncbi:MAG: hypothetical protein GSR79_05055 [Desulfurococcales archaeon]|nr:hypothetical protein [Desulfurococcales archaeon]